MDSPNNHSPHSSNNGRSKLSGAKDLAAEVIRKKLDNIYADEPMVQMEEGEMVHAKNPSKHQQYMQHLTTSGKSEAEVQTAWHAYYMALSDKEKHEVWDEFYKESAKAKAANHLPKPVEPTPAAAHPTHKRKNSNRSRTVTQVKRQLLGKVEGRQKLSRKHHVQSVLFGLTAGAIVMIILLFGFFNERIIAPFVTPSKTVSDTPIIVDNAAAVSGEPKVIIPKINVEIPVVYDAPDIQEATIQAALERGVVHYPTTPNPGQVGNAVIFGHSSNNILNKGAYKFAFVLLNRLQEGDTFMLTKDGKRYVYRVYKKHVVKPDDISVLSTQEKPSTATLITCDPPGTSINRLIVVGEQISPDPATNGASTAIQTDNQPAVIPSNSLTLWQRIKDFFTS